MQNDSSFKTTREVAEVLGVSPAQVTRLVASGDLTPAVKAPGLRGAFMFTHEEVEQAQALRGLQAVGKPKAHPQGRK